MPTNPVLEKTYDPTSVEPEMYALWKKSGAFTSKPDQRPREQTYCIVIPPPNVTGALHLGHALNNTLQDILIRYHRMRGFNTLWQPGTDHAGIATQAVVERRILKDEGKSRHDLGRDELVRRIWEWKEQYEARILGQLELMGCSCDWTRKRFTLDDGLRKAVRHQFFRLFKDGLIFRGKRLVNWDTELQTAVANDEVYHESVKGHFWHFKYPVIDPKPGEPDHVIIATTRPETMLGDTAVAVHPDPEGFFAKAEAELRHVCDRSSNRSSKDADEAVAKLAALHQRRASHLAGLVTLKGMAKDGRMLRLPLVDRKIPLITDEWANPMKGSGCVKITPAHDPNDYEVGSRHPEIGPPVNVLSPDGTIAKIIETDGAVNPHSGDYEGLAFSTDGRKKVVDDMEALDLLHDKEDHEVEIGYSDRSKTPIEPFLSDQWFVKTKDITNDPTGNATDAQTEPRASARADVGSSSCVPHTPDLSQGATLLTWTTYGTWLPGDDRGFVSRVDRSDYSHDLRNLPGEPFDADDAQIRASSAERMQGEPVRLRIDPARVVLAALIGTCERHAIDPLAIAIMANHVHVLCQSDKHGIDLLQLFKGTASRELGKQFDIGDAPRWWTKSGSRRRVRKGSDLTAAIEYVKDQEHPLLVWSFDMRHGEAHDICEIARAEAGGSDETGSTARAEARGSVETGDAARTDEVKSGIVLGDGSHAPGLAQAAMDAVEDGRISVFPERYAKSYLDWLGEKRDWCISRQLWWGHRIPVWVAEFSHGHFDSRAHAERKQQTLLSELQEFLNELAALSSDLSGKPESRFTVRRPAEVTVYCLISTSDEQGQTDLDDVASGIGLAQNVALGDPVVFTQRIFDGDPRYEVSQKIRRLLKNLDRDEDVLDTWFSSALWPFSTLGWPEETDHLKQYYPGAVLVTSRDIITNWVARMVMFGLYSMGEVPFRHVYIHPKILDGRGETMSKSKGNGVDPVDAIHTHGADAMRYALADLTTETQDVRMPVEYVCPHCGKLTDQAVALKAEVQARKSRGEKLDRKLQPIDCLRITCANHACGKPFASQWATDELKEKLGLGRETSDKFDIGRNFCTKLWNAARFAFMNLEGTECHELDIASLPPEDRWILARLSQTIRRYHDAIAKYQFSASVKILREFFWEALCDWYIELTKPRFTTPEPRASARAVLPKSDDAPPSTDASARAISPEPNDAPSPANASARADSAAPGAASATAKQVLAFSLDQILRLFHPTIPHITERLWQTLGSVAPKRGLPGIADLNTDTHLVLAEFPPVEGYPAFDDESILDVFADLQAATRGVRELRSKCGVLPRQRVAVTIVATEDHIESFKGEAHVVKHMAGIGTLSIVTRAARPANSASVTMGGLRIFVHDISDDEADRARTMKALADVEKQIVGKEKKLSNEKFVANAKPEVVAAERTRLEALVKERQTLAAHLSKLEA